jgi:ATP-dependent helicase/nuclease subunit A
MRLLYVAMTRAQSWLIVAAAGAIGADAGDDDAEQVVWYRLIQEAMGHIGATARVDGGLTFAEGVWPPNAPHAPQVRAETLVLPAWINAAAKVESRANQPLNPSNLGGAKALPGDYTLDDDNRAAMDRGTRIHLLLEYLPDHPASDWPQIAAALLPNAPDRAALLDEVATTITQHPDLFTPDALTEAPVTGTLNRQPMVGSIDRLLVTPTRVLAVDFKSNLLVPETVETVPDGLLRQMAAYHAALTQIYPDRAVDVALLWTRSAQLMLLPPDMLRSALARATSP